MGMSLNVIIQNMAQLKARYEKTWEVITGNCDSLLFLGGKEESTLKYISESLGKETIDVQGYNRTKGKQSSTSENNSIMGRELMQPNEIATMPISDCILMIRSHNPFYCTKYPIEKHPNYRFLADYDKANAFDIRTVHSVAAKEFMESCSRKKADTDTVTPIAASEQEKVEVAFQRSKQDYIVTFETYGDAELFAEELLDNVSEEYTDEALRYGSIHPLESFDLGEPIREPREEVNSDEESADAARSVMPEKCYIPPEEAVQSIEDLDAEDVVALIQVTEHYAEAVKEDLSKWFEDDEFDMGI